MSGKLNCCPGVLPGGSFRSAPAQNVLPAPVMTTTRVDVSVFAASSASVSCSSRRLDSALRFSGESSVIVVITPSVADRTTSHR